MDILGLHINFSNFTLTILNSEPMKKSILSIFILGIFILSGCDPADQYPISYKINGTPWYASSAPAFMTVSNKISVNAISTVQNQKKTIFLFSQYNVGTYQLDHINNDFMYVDSDTSNGWYAQSNNPATLVITEYNASTKKVVGTFYGKLYNSAKTDSVLITDGKFNLNYQ